MRRASLLLLATVAGCGGGEGSSERLSVVATTTQAADLARNVGANRIELHQVLTANADPHDYEPRPSDARALTDADVVIRSGGEVDHWLDDLLDSARGDAEVVTLLEAAGGEDPHWWQDPRAAMNAVRAIRDALSDSDPPNRSTYSRAASTYLAELGQLDRRVRALIARVPPARRKLVTTHDSFGRFARRYGLELVGTAIPARSTQAQPSARDVRRLVERIREEGVPAIFPEHGVSVKLGRAIAREAGIADGNPLWADALGPKGSGGESYIAAMESNARTLLAGLRG